MSLHREEFESWQEWEDELDLRARLENSARQNGEAELSILMGERISPQVMEEEVQRASLLSFEELIEEYNSSYLSSLPAVWRAIYGEELKYRRESGRLNWKQRLQLPVELLFN